MSGSLGLALANAVISAGTSSFFGQALKSYVPMPAGKFSKTLYSIGVYSVSSYLTKHVTDVSTEELRRDINMTLAIISSVKQNITDYKEEQAKESGDENDL